jgi:hypothetical protein
MFSPAPLRAAVTLEFHGRLCNAILEVFVISSRRAGKPKKSGSWRRMAIAGVLLVLLIVLAPFATARLTSLPLDWKGLSDIGQAYGALSAVLSAFALCGIAASLVMQRQQYRLSEAQTFRERHYDLIKLTFEDPELKPCWGESSSGSGLTEKEAAYCNLIIDHWYMMWRIGHLSQAELHRVAASFFKGEAGRAYWAAFGNPWMTAEDRISVKFLETFDIEFNGANARGRPTVSRMVADDEVGKAAMIESAAKVSRPLERPTVSPVWNLAAAAAAGISVALLFRRILPPFPTRSGSLSDL